MKNSRFMLSIIAAVWMGALALPVSAAPKPENLPLPPGLARAAIAQRSAEPIADPGASAVLAADVPQGQVFEDKLSQAKVFGDWLFLGKFAQQSFTGFNPEYLITVGDVVNLQLWGAVDLQAELKVDAQGNVFVPRVGPVKVLNARNGDLNQVVKSQVERVYRADVGVYATLSAAQPVKVFVSGFVRAPGLFNGYASDSVLQFLDRAGGVNPASGSYLDVRVIRSGEPVYNVNLYDFLLKGRMTQVQFRDGDTIIVGPLSNTVEISGLVASPYRIEFKNESLSLQEAIQIAGVVPNATHARITRNRGTSRSVDYVSLIEAGNVELFSGDQVDVVADKTLKSIIVFVEGEHQGRAQYVLPYGATLGNLLEVLQPGAESDMDDIQLFRQSVAERQKSMLDESLRVLESSVLAARSGTIEIAELRVREAELLNQFIVRARQVVPKGQVVLSSDQSRKAVTLEDGDRIRVPRKTQLVAVHGEVYFPSSFLYKKEARPEGYIEMAGGYTQKANRARVLVLRPSGQIDVFRDGWSIMSQVNLQPGDEVLVLPKVDEKGFQFTKDLVQIIYQIALATGVVLRL